MYSFDIGSFGQGIHIYVHIITTLDYKAESLRLNGIVNNSLKTKPSKSDKPKYLDEVISEINTEMSGDSFNKTI